LGATKGINYKTTDWGEEVQKIAPEGVDFTVDFILGTALAHEQITDTRWRVSGTGYSS